MISKKCAFACFFVLKIFSFQAQLDKGLISLYYFSGNAMDGISYIDGTVKGATLSTDRFGNTYSAYCFDGKNDYINLGVNSHLKLKVMSISLWVKINEYRSDNLNYPSMTFLSTRTGDFVQSYEAYALGTYNSNHKFIGSNCSTIQQFVVCTSEISAEVDNWYHLVYMFDIDTNYLYVDGRFQQKSYKGYVSTYLANDSIVLGCVGNGLSDTSKYKNHSWFNGCLDDLKFYNRLLSPSEIHDLYNEPNPKFVVEPKNNKTKSILSFFKPYWVIVFAILMFIVLTVVSVRWRLKYVRKKVKEQNDLLQKFAQMEMKALRSQMNPHFIFNAINSIQHYVLTNEKELANKYLVKFSQLMRNILDLSKQELINLSSELETVKLYLDIESLRFNNAFSYSINVSSNVSINDVRLPPLIIQPFVENAIWHGLLLKEGNKKLIINVSKSENELIIEIDDNGIGRETSRKFGNKELKRKSFGMDITQDRLNILGKVFGLFISFHIHDKKDEMGIAQGTTVYIKIKL